MGARRRLLLAGGLLAGLVTSGCSTMPDHGPVVDARVPVVNELDRVSDIDPVPPSPGESRTELVQGFLAAMTASPIRLDVAREYLTDSADAAWDPEASTVTYAAKLPPREHGTEISVRLNEADRLDRTGAWQGRLDPGREVLHFHTVEEKGQFRISDPPDSLIVPAEWFAQRFRQASLYFFDPSARILVPQPVFVQRGDQFASALIGGLLAGPGEDLNGVVRSFLPAGLRIGVSVPVSPQGVAEVNLVGDPGLLTGGAVPRVLAQLAWTLRQEPDIRALTLNIGGEQVPLPGGLSAYPLDQADRYDPTGYHASTRLYGLRSGLLVSSYTSDFEPLVGPLSTKPHDLRSVSLDLEGDRAAGVTADRRSVVEAPVATTTVDPAAVVHTVVDGGTEFLRPAWDFSGRLWLVDRADGHAQISYVVDGHRRTLRLDGISGRDVTSFLVSRDGTRFVAVVAGRGTDQLRVGRLSTDPRGMTARGGPTIGLAGTNADPLRIEDVAWTSATTLAVLTPRVPGGVSEVRTVRVDGSPSTSDDLTTTLAAPLVGLAGSPVTDVTPYGVGPAGLIDLTTGTAATIVGRPVTSLEYVG